ncbi:MAG: response regulator transcription factor [Luteolibacter sp.]
MKPPIHVLLVEDHPGYREVITRALKRVEDIELIEQFGTAEMALRFLQGKRPTPACDVILLDLNLPGISGIESIHWFREAAPEAKIIVLTQSERESDVLDAIQRGVAGYLLKSASIDEITGGIRTVAAGGASLDPHIARYILQTLQSTTTDATSNRELSERELEILRLLADGRVKKEIAEDLSISVTTVAYHVRHIYEKLEVMNAAAAVHKAHQSGLFTKKKK